MHLLNTLELKSENRHLKMQTCEKGKKLSYKEKVNSSCFKVKVCQLLVRFWVETQGKT